MTSPVTTAMDTQLRSDTSPYAEMVRGDSTMPIPAPPVPSDQILQSQSHNQTQTQKQTLIQSQSPQPQISVPTACPAASCHTSWARQTGLTFFSLYILVKYYAKRAFIVFWHELSMDPRVRLSPWSPPPKDEIIPSWLDVYLTRQRRIFFVVIHTTALMGLYYCLTGKVSAYTIIWASFLGVGSSVAVTAGAHRLWSHHAYKANTGLRFVMAAFQTIAIQYSVLNWVRDHRQHHKFMDSDADPHNSNRGFFFSHMGWALMLPHPQVLEKKKLIDSRDVESDWIVKYQYKYYVPLVVLLCYIIPTIVPWYFWGENLWISHLVATQLRHVVTLHGTFLINSAAHMYGTKPYDKNINPTENLLVAFATCGDGWHNYHHTFPWDYKNAELWNYKLNISTAFIDFCAWFGWAHDLKTVPPEMVAKRVQKTGDGTHPHHSHEHSSGVWGWNDKDLPEEDRALAHITNKKEE